MPGLGSTFVRVEGKSTSNKLSCVHACGCEEGIEEWKEFGPSDHTARFLACSPSVSAAGVDGIENLRELVGGSFCSYFEVGDSRGQVVGCSPEAVQTVFQIDRALPHTLQVSLQVLRDDRVKVRSTPGG